MRYYDLDINGKVKGSYAVPQPKKTLVLLEEAPNEESKWDGSAWVPDQDVIDVKASAAAKATLNALDLKSIRSLREYVSAKNDAPQILKDYEAQAVEERKKVK